jgi:acetyltransferase-like isoleucine patch superfamily enzyme
MIHPLSDVKSQHIGKHTRIWQYAVILEGAVIGDHCNINCHTFIENNVVIGDHVTVKSGVYLWDGISIHDGAFIGPNVTFTNDKYPRSQKYPDAFQPVVIGEYASIGAGSVILGGIKIGRFAMVAAGSLISKDVPDFALMMGRPAAIAGWVDEEGGKLEHRNGIWYSKDGGMFRVENNSLNRI